MQESKNETLAVNVVGGVIMADWQELERTLALDAVGNIMINIGYPFMPEVLRKAPTAGNQLALTLLAVKMNSLSRVVLKDYLERLLFLAQVGRPAVAINEVEELIATRDRLLAWFAKGWMMQVQVIPMLNDDFYDWVEWKIQRETRLSLENDRRVCRQEVETKLEVKE